METLVYSDANVRILDYECHQCRGGPGPEECATDCQVVLPRSGHFVRHWNGQRFSGDANHALFFNAGDTHAVSHPVDGGDRCTVLAFAEDVMRDCLLESNPQGAAGDTCSFPISHMRTSARLDLAHRHLLRLACRDEHGPEVSELAFDILAALVSDARPAGAGGTRQKSSTRKRHDDVVAAVREGLSARLHQKLDLCELAAAVNVSAFHLSRVFRRCTGQSLTAYHHRLRLRAALERILEGETDLTRLANDLGFSSHSHFGSLFAREFGRPPSAHRELLSPGELRALLRTAVRKH